MKIKKKCATCGSDRVRVDAWAAWVEEIQDWELDTTYDAAFCLHCDAGCAIKDEEIPE